MLNTDQFRRVHALLREQGGFTVNPHTGQSIEHGISVAPYGNEMKTPSDQMNTDVIRGYYTRNLSRFGPEGGRNASFGGWRSEDSDFLDTPTVYKHKPGQVAASRKQMVVARQEASFDLDSFQETFNPFHPEARRKQDLPPHELADLAVKSREHADFVMAQPEVQAWVNQPRGGLAWAMQRDADAVAARSRPPRG